MDAVECQCIVLGVLCDSVEDVGPVSDLHFPEQIIEISLESFVISKPFFALLPLSLSLVNRPIGQLDNIVQYPHNFLINIIGIMADRNATPVHNIELVLIKAIIFDNPLQ